MKLTPRHAQTCESERRAMVNEIITKRRIIARQMMHVMMKVRRQERDFGNYLMFYEANVNDVS